MKKKVISLLIALSMACSLCACGSSGKDTTKTDETVQENAAEESPEADGVEDVPDKATDETPDEASDEINEYGLTDVQMEALIASVKESVTTEYLEKYDIVASDFEVRPFDANDLANYDSSGTYTGDDPHEWSAVWDMIDNVIWQSRIGMSLSVSMALEDPIELEMALKEKDSAFEDTLAEQNDMNDKEGSNSYDLDTSTEQYALENAVFMGIAKFINRLETKECAEVLYNLAMAENNSETIPVTNDSGFGREYHSITMFDCVISENIQFE